MIVENAVTITAHQAQTLKTNGPEPIFMLNLLKFRDFANYPDPGAPKLSGKAAYQIYADSVSAVIKTFGGELVFSADVTGLTVGHVEELWDAVAIARYPSRQAMLEMIKSSAYQDIAIHRTAGLAGQLNIETSTQSATSLKGA